jgi:hypothetical protein
MRPYAGGSQCAGSSLGGSGTFQKFFSLPSCMCSATWVNCAYRAMRTDRAFIEVIDLALSDAVTWVPVDPSDIPRLQAVNNEIANFHKETPQFGDA